MPVVPATEWVDLSHRLIQHGRRVCLARRPRCAACSLAELCPKVGVADRRQSGREAARRRPREGPRGRAASG